MVVLPLDWKGFQAVPRESDTPYSRMDPCGYVAHVILASMDASCEPNYIQVPRNIEYTHATSLIAVEQNTCQQLYHFHCIN